MTELEPEKHALDEAVEDSAKRLKLDENNTHDEEEDDAVAASTTPGSVEPSVEPSEPATAEPEVQSEGAEPKSESGEAKDEPMELTEEPAEPAEPTEAEGEATVATAEPTGDVKTEDPGKDEDAGEELTPLERAKRAAEQSKLEMPEDLDTTEPTGELPKHQHKYFTSAIKAIKRLKDASPFLAPVDPIKQGVPDYFKFISSPMDLGTMEKNLAAGSYTTVREIADDFNLIVANCIIFNGEEAGISVMAKGIGQSFQKHLLNAPPYDESEAKRRRGGGGTTNRTSLSGAATAPPAAVVAATTPTAARGSASPPVTEKQHLQAPGVPVIRRSSMTADGRPKRAIHPPAYREMRDAPPKTKKQLAELKFCGNILRELMSRKNESMSYPFLQPVDPVAQGVPNYFEIIKEPMDLSTINTKLSTGIYDSAEEFEADIRLMFRNCYVFNPDGTPVSQLGHRLEALFDRRWLEKPLPTATPPRGHSDDDDSVDEYDEAGITNPAIKVLEDNIANLKQQLRKLKREALAAWRDKGGRRKSKAGSSVRRMSSNKKNGKDEPITKVTYEMKKEISEKIPTLPDKKLRKVLAIIQESMPQLKNNGQDEIELDMDQLDESTQRQLYNYVVRKMEDDYNSAPTNSKSPGGAGAPQKKKKSKPLTEDEQNRQIEEIQNKLAQFDQHKSGNTPQSASPVPTSAAPQEDDDSSSDDDRQQSDSDDSSSEEE